MSTRRTRLAVAQSRRFTLMAEFRVQRLSVALWLLTIAIGTSVLVLGDVSIQALILGSTAITAAQLLSVPTPSGERLYLGFGVASALPLLVDEWPSVATVYAFGMAGSWLVAGGRGSSR